MLQVRELAVEVGGNLAADASFTVRPGDKVGLVGRNGAGKTTCCEVLGGRRTRFAGRRAASAAASATCRRTRASTASTDDATALSHVLSGRGLDEAAVRLEKLRLRDRGGPSRSQHRPLLRARSASRIDGGYAAESRGAPPRRRARAAPDRARPPARRRCRAASGGGSSWPRILFAGSDVLLLDEPTNHLDSDAKDWLLELHPRATAAPCS